jgi:hypothetical protein
MIGGESLPQDSQDAAYCLSHPLFRAPVTSLLRQPVTELREATRQAERGDRRVRCLLRREKAVVDHAVAARQTAPG